MSKIEAMIEKVKALINAPSCCAEAKEAANKWLEAVNTEKQDEAAKALIEEIAAEKAGILKRDVPIIYIGKEEKSAKVIRECAEKVGAPCREISKNAYEIIESTDKYIDFFSVNAYDKYVTWKLHNSGVYQVENGMLAIKALEYLFPEKEDMSLWRRALANVVWQGRMEEIMPGIVVDGAHNIGAVEAFVKSVKQMKDTKNVILFSSVSDKDYEKMIQYLCLHMKAECYIITEIPDTRGEEPEQLAEVFRKVLHFSASPGPHCHVQWKRKVKRAKCIALARFIWQGS